MTSHDIAKRLMQIAGGVMAAAYLGVCIQARTRSGSRSSPT